MITVLGSQGKYQHKPPFPYVAGMSHSSVQGYRARDGSKREDSELTDRFATFPLSLSHPPSSLSRFPSSPSRLLPLNPGAEFSGVISASSPIPDGCDYIPGKTRVFGAGQGAYAEKIAVDYRKLIEIPHNMGMEEAAGLYVTMPTSYAGLVNRANVKEGDWVLVHVSLHLAFFLFFL